LGNNLCKSSGLKAGGEEFSAVCLSGWRRPAWCGPRSPKGQSHATGWALAGCAKDLGAPRARADKERWALQELPLLLTHPCHPESWGPPRVGGLGGARSDHVPAEGPAGGSEGGELVGARVAAPEPVFAGLSVPPAASLLQSSVPPAPGLGVPFEC